MKKLIFAVVVLVIALSGCSNLLMPEVESFETVSSEVESMYGEPNRTENIIAGVIYWYYDDVDNHTILAAFRESWDGSWSYTVDTYQTFEQVVSETVAEYGQPEDIESYDSSNYKTVDYWYWSRGICFTFKWTTYDDTLGWVLDSTYTFTPF